MVIVGLTGQTGAGKSTVAAALASVPVAALLPGAAWAQKPLVLGFSQVGAESEWRTANTESIKSAAKEAGIELKFSDAQQKAGKPDQGHPQLHCTKG